MKAGIHPDYQPCRVQCACGNVFETRSSVTLLKVDICSACHPFYTGAQKFIDTAGRVDRFRKRYAKTEGAKPEEGKPAETKGKAAGKA